MAEHHMRPDDLEFLIAQYADGSLDAKRSADLEAVLRRDAAARAMLESYRRVDAALTGVVAAQPVPEVAWDRLSARISQQVSVLSGPLSDESEEVISRLSSGDLPPEQSRELQESIAADGRSRLALAEYRSLDRAFEDARSQPMPQVRWDQFAKHISSSIDRVEQASADALRIGSKEDQGSAASSGVLGRIGNFFAQPRRLALAACVLIAASLSLQLINRGGGVGPTGPANPSAVQPTPGAGNPGAVATHTPPMTIQVGPSFEPAGSTVTSIRVGPPSGPGFDLTALADWAKESHSIIGRATTRPNSSNEVIRQPDKPGEPSSNPSSDRPGDPGSIFNQ